MGPVNEVAIMGRSKDLSDFWYHVPSSNYSHLVPDHYPESLNLALVVECRILNGNS